MNGFDPPRSLDVPGSGPVLVAGVLSEEECKNAAEVKIEVADGVSEY